MSNQNSVNQSARKRERGIAINETNYFGETLREFRVERNITQGEAAKLLGVTQSQWSAYEKGVTRPYLDTIISIANQFKVDPLVIIGRSLDKSRFNDPVQTLTFEDYLTITHTIGDFRKQKLRERVNERVKELQSLIES